MSILVTGAGWALVGLLAAPPPTPEAPEPTSRAYDGPGALAAPGDSVELLPPREPEPEPEPEPEASPPPPTLEDAAANESPEDTEGLTRHVVVGSVFGDPEGIPRIAGSAHAIGERELEAHEYDDVHKVMATVPGVYVRGEDGFGLRPNIGLRGANSDRSAKVTLMEDGVPMAPAAYSAPAAYYFPLTTRLAGVEVFKGPAAVRHGPNTIGGAINFRTRPIPLFPTGFVDLGWGQYGYLKGHTYWGTTHEGFGILLEGARVQSKGFKDLDGGGNTGFGKNDAMLKLGYSTPEGRRTRHVIQLKGGITSELSHETYLGLTDADFEQNPYRRYAASQLGRMKWWRSQGQATYLVYQDDLDFQVDLYRMDFHRVWRRLNGIRNPLGRSLSDILASPGGGNEVYLDVLRGDSDSAANPLAELMVVTNDRRFISQGGVARVGWHPRWKRAAQDLEFGIRVHHDYVLRDHEHAKYEMTSGVMVPTGDPIDPNDRDDEDFARVFNRANSLATAFHVHDVVTIVDRVAIAPGMRLEIIRNEFNDKLDGAPGDTNLTVVPVPGLGVHVTATEWLGVFAGAHRGFSPVAPGQPGDTKPESSINYEAGARVLWEGLQAEAIGFFSDYDNLTGSCTGSSGCPGNMLDAQFNAGSVFVWGVEALLDYQHRFARGFRLGGGARYTYTGSYFRTAFTSGFPQFGAVEVGDRLPYVPEHLVGGSANTGGDRWDFRVGLTYNGAMRDVAGRGPIPGNEKVPGFFLLDLAAEVRVLKMLRVYALLNNATANEYMASRRPFGARPGAPITFMMGIKVMFTPR